MKTSRKEDLEMDYEESMEASGISSGHDFSQKFQFSVPNMFNFNQPINQEFSSEQGAYAFNEQPSIFTFARPTVLAEPSNSDLSDLQPSGNQYKPKIARNSFKPAVNVLALKDTVMFEQLKKNSRIQVSKTNPDNSLTCTNVPELLLTKTAVKEHFAQFGNLQKVIIRRKKQMVTVIYSSKEEAELAYNKGAMYLGERFNIEWTKLYGSPKSPLKKKDFQKNVVATLLKSSEEEIKSELDALMDFEYNAISRNNLDTAQIKKNKMLQSKGIGKSHAQMERMSIKGEKHKSDSQISDLLPNATMEELQNIIQQAAQTSEDKYKVLEARDRLMRLKQVKSHTLAAAKVMSGICPDMCPEKERLMRESKRQVALYEQLDTNEYRINHTIAIKQYSRSSADQEEPMAHDLRPVRSLKMTMSYLLHEIANLCDQQGTNLGEWYHFLWDRTRGIRKDITQQELCCIDSVELVEQCARFHMVCSERLCAAEPSIFDKKINSDNLTKCLQSLKYMYHDLRVEGISCKNEAEFRAYIILLNLNNGNFMWDLQRLPTNIQKSVEVQFALKVYSALESNDYYKFFKLVQATTYLNACILLRYFNQVRLKALSVMVKAYCRTTSTAYPLYELIDMLGFEDENEAIHFCEQVGLNTSKDGLYVLFNRHNFNMPVLNIKQNRACNLIESKRTMNSLSIGECIAGGKMPERSYKHHKPHNSFDARGYLMPKSINAEDQNKDTTVTMSDPYEFVDDSTDNCQSVTLTPEKMQTSLRTKETVGTIKVESDTNVPSKLRSEAQVNKFSPKIEAKVKEKTEKQCDTKPFSFALPPPTTGDFTLTASRTSNIFSKQFEPFQKNAASTFTGSNKTVSKESSHGNSFRKSVSSAAVFPAACLKEEVEKQSIDSAHFMNRGRDRTKETNDVARDVSKEWPNSFIPIMDRKGQAVHEEPRKKTKLKEDDSHIKMSQMDEAAKEVLADLQTEVLKAYCTGIVREEMNKLHACQSLSEDINDEILDEVIHDVCGNILKEELCNTQKLHELSVKMKNRVVIKYFNIWRFNVLRRKQQRLALENTPVWLQRHSTEQCAKLLYSKKQDLVIENMLHRKQFVEKNVQDYSKVLAPIEAIIYIGIKQNLKLLSVDVHTNYYWKLVISWPDLHDKAVLWHHKKIMNKYFSPDDYAAEPIMKLHRPNEIETLHICIRHFEGLIRDHNLIGSDALLFIADACEDVNFVIKRLTKTVLSRDKLMPIPVVFIVLGSSSLKIEEKISPVLDDLLKSGYLSMYTVMRENLSEKSVLNLTQSAVLWLSMHKSQQNPLEMDYLQDICNASLTEELWLRIVDDSAYNEKLSCALEEPNFIIDLHNEAVTHLMDILLDPETFMYTRFAPEFRKFIKCQHSIPHSYEYFDDKWRNEDYKVKIEDVLYSFKLPRWKFAWPIEDSETLNRVITDYCQESLTPCDPEVSCNILSNLFFASGVSTALNFTDILLYIIKTKVYSIEEDLKVVYNKNHLKHFRTLPWWLKSNLFVEYKTCLKKVNAKKIGKENKKPDDMDELVVKRKRVHSPERNDFELKPLAMFCDDSRSRVMEVDYISNRIENILKRCQEKSFLIEEKLKSELYTEIEYK